MIAGARRPYWGYICVGSCEGRRYPMMTRSWMSRVGAVVATWLVLATLIGGTSARAAAEGLLRVTQPLSSAVRTQILVDGQIADSWGLNWLKEAPGSHTDR